MPSFLWQSEFNAPNTPPAPVPPTTGWFLGADFVSVRKKRFIPGEISYPLQQPAPLVVPPDIGNFSLEGFTYSRKIKKINADLINWYEPAAIPSEFIPFLPPHTGTYEEIFDFGITINNVIVNVTYNTEIVTGVISILTEIRTSTDGSNWTLYTPGTTIFVSTVRFVNVRFTFTGADDKSAIIMTALHVFLNVRFEVDSGTVNALSGDAGGTHVLFNKNFLSSPTITLTPQTNTVVFAVYDTLTSTGFNVYVFNAAGARTSTTVTWHARGILI